MDSGSKADPWNLLYQSGLLCSLHILSKGVQGPVHISSSFFQVWVYLKACITYYQIIFLSNMDHKYNINIAAKTERIGIVRLTKKCHVDRQSIPIIG